MAEAVRANVSAGSRRKSKSANKKNASSSLANLLATVSPALMASSATSSATLPTTSTWYPVVPPIPDQANEKLAKAASKKRKRLGQCKRKRDRIVQEIAKSQRVDRNLNKQLTATNNRLAKLQSAQAQLPTARQVFTQ